MWLWKKYGGYPSQHPIVPRLVTQLAAQIEAAGQSVEPELLAHYNDRLGRMPERPMSRSPLAAKPSKKSN